MILFLHDERLHDRAETLNGQAFSTNRLMCCCYSGCGCSRPCKTYLPFYKLRSTVTDSSLARVPLIVDHHRLLFVDFIKLKPDTKVTFLISCMNHFSKDKRSLKIEAEMMANPLVPRVISGKSYFTFQDVVHSNPKYNDFIDSNLTKHKILHLCGFH